MVNENETSEESLLEFSKKYLDTVFGESDITNVNIDKNIKNSNIDNNNGKGINIYSPSSTINNKNNTKNTVTLKNNQNNLIINSKDSSSSIQSTSIQSTSIQSTSIQSTSIQSTSIQSTSIQSTSIQSKSMQSTSMPSIKIITTIKQEHSNNDDNNNNKRISSDSVDSTESNDSITSNETNKTNDTNITNDTSTSTSTISTSTITPISPLPTITMTNIITVSDEEEDEDDEDGEVDECEEDDGGEDDEDGEDEDECIEKYEENVIIKSKIKSKNSKGKKRNKNKNNVEFNPNNIERKNSNLKETTLKRRSIISIDDNIYLNNNNNINNNSSSSINNISNNDSSDNGGGNDLGSSETMTEELHIETENPSHLFWVPAHLHPEIAPNEFMKWLKTHAKEGFSSGSAALRRRKSTLSRQYIPDEDDEIDETDDHKNSNDNGNNEKDENNDKKPSLPFLKSKKSATDLKDLSKSKLKSYELAYDGNISPASETNKLNLLRRSISLNIPNMMGSNFDPSDPNIFDRHSSPDVDSPILVPRIMPALKRAARTKLRRNSVAGEQNPRRFSYHRRTKSTHSPSNKNDNSNNIQQHANLLNVPKISVTDSPSQLSQSIENLIIEDIGDSLPRLTNKDDNLEEGGNYEEEGEDYEEEDDYGEEEEGEEELFYSEPEPIKNETIELDCIDVKDGSGPIRITLKDDETKLSSSLPSLSSNRRSNSLPVDALDVSQENRTPETRRPLAEKLKIRVNTLSNKLNSVTSKSSSSSNNSNTISNNNKTSTSSSPTSLSPISPISPLSPLSPILLSESASPSSAATTPILTTSTPAVTTSTPSSSSTTTSPTTSPIATVTPTSSTKRSSAWSYLLPWSSNSDESKNKKQKSDKFVEKSDIDNRMLSVVDNNNNVSVVREKSKKNKLESNNNDHIENSTTSTSTSILSLKEKSKKLKSEKSEKSEKLETEDTTKSTTSAIAISSSTSTTTSTTTTTTTTTATTTTSSSTISTSSSPPVLKEKSSKLSLASFFSWSSQKSKSSEDQSSNTSSSNNNNNTNTQQQSIVNSNKKTKYTNYNRFPIHVERAIYRLSHIKLANPRRPLHEQVLISNMMFWYLSLINKQQMEHGENNNPNIRHAHKETLKAKSKMGKSVGERKRRKADKKAAAEARRRGGGSNAEIAYKAPQYDMLQFSQQFITPPMSPVQYSSSPHTKENEYSDVNNGNVNGNNDVIDENEDVEGHQPPSNQYHHFRDSYVSDGTDGGYLEEAETDVGNVGGGDIGDVDNHYDNYNNINNINNDGDSDNVDHYLNNKIKNKNNNSNGSSNKRSVSPTHKSGKSLFFNSKPKSLKMANSRQSVPQVSKNSLKNNLLVSRPRSSGADTLNSYKLNNTDTKIDDEDDDVPLGLFQNNSTPITK